MARVHFILEDVLDGVPETSGIIYPQRTKDESGIFKVFCSASPPTLTALEIRCQGRADDTAPWYTIATIVHGDIVSGSGVFVVTMFPQMRIETITITGANINSAYIIE